MKRKRRNHSPEFKARVALEAVQGIKTAAEIANEYEIHPVMVSNWKKELLEGLPKLFDQKTEKTDKSAEKEQEKLHRKVGQLTMEVDFLEKKCKQLGIPLNGRNS